MADYTAPVIETFLQSGLDPEQCVVVGGAVLALEGLRSAQDVDLVVSPSLFAEVAIRRLTPGGVAMKPANRARPLERYISNGAIGEGCLSLDVLGLTSAQANREFAFIKASSKTHAHNNGLLYALSIETVRGIKVFKDRLKDIADVALIDQFLS